MSHGPPDLPIHLVPPLGGLLSTRGGHGKELQPCFTIREDFTDRRTVKHRHFQSFSAGPEARTFTGSVGRRPTLFSTVTFSALEASTLALGVPPARPRPRWECAHRL